MARTKKVFQSPNGNGDFVMTPKDRDRALAAYYKKILEEAKNPGARVLLYLSFCFY